MSSDPPGGSLQVDSAVDHRHSLTTVAEQPIRGGAAQLRNNDNLLTVHHNHDLSSVASTITPDPLLSFPGRPPGLHPLAIPPLTTIQVLYIVVLQMIGAAFIDGIANFGIGCAMYLNASNVRIWILKNNTVAGDMAITIFIQGILTFCIASGMVHVDLRKNKVMAFAYPWPDTSWGTAQKLSPEGARTRFGRLWRKFNNDQGLSRGLHFFSGSDVNDIFDSRLTWAQFWKRLCWSVWKGSVLSVIYFFILWPISIAIVSPIWADKNIGKSFTAPIIKGVYGFVYGLIMNPVCAMIAMGSEDSVRHHRAEMQKIRFEHPDQEAMTTTAAERVSMMVETSTGPGSAIGQQRIPDRVQELRRSLDQGGLHGFGPMNDSSGGISLSQENSSSTHQPDLRWKPTDVHRRRSIDAPRRSTSTRYNPNPTSAPIMRSTSTGNNRSRPNSGIQEAGLFGTNDQPVLPTIPHLRRLTETSIIFE